MKVSRSASSPSSPSAADGPSGLREHGEPSSGSQQHAASGQLASLADLNQARRSALKRPLGDDGAGGSGEPAAKRRRHSVTFVMSCSGKEPSRRPLVRQPVPDPDQRRVNQQIRSNQAAFAKRQLIAKLPAARLLQGELAAEIGRHLPPGDQRRLDAVLPRSAEARYAHARGLPPALAGVYLNRDREALMLAAADTDKHGAPLSADALLDRAGWLLQAGTRAAATPGVNATNRIRDAMDEAEARLLETFDRAGPQAQAEAVRHLIASCAHGTLDDALRFAQTALSPQRFHALPSAEQPGALAALVEHLDNVEEIEWDRTAAIEDGEMRQEREAELEDQRFEGMSATMPLLLDAARRIGQVPSDVAGLTVRSVVSLVDRQVPDAATQRAALDLLDTQLPHLQGDDRSAAIERLASILSHFEQPEQQWRVLDMLSRRAPGTPPSEDRLSHLNPAARVGVINAVFHQLAEVADDGVRSGALTLLGNQLEPGRLGHFPDEALQSILTDAVMLDVPANSRQSLFALVERTLDALPGERIAQPLRQMFRRALQPPVADLPELEQQAWAGLNQRMQQAWLRLLPRVPAAPRADLLAFTVTVAPQMLSVALSELVAGAPDTHRTMLAGIVEPQREFLAGLVVHAWMQAVGPMPALTHQIVSAQPPAQQATAAASLAATFAWAASAVSAELREAAAPAMEAAAMGVFSAVPADQLVPTLAACIRRDEFPLLPAVASLHLRNLHLADEARVLAALTHALSGDAPRTRELALAFVEARLAACVSGQPDGFARLARQVPIDGAHTWAMQLQGELDEELALQLATQPHAEMLHTRVERMDAGTNDMLELRLAADAGPSLARIDTHRRHAMARAMLDALHARLADPHD
ncbi:type III effector protein [Ralstonia solanacearum]|uniref:type III effector protein n=1 Tax=Ralstonia solanacearum TaxID=305 RepID=UPI0018D154C6|nr:type III effector protein [Ralstonia solanacearum]